MAEGGADLDALVRKYRGKGQDDGRVYTTLRALGYGEREVKSAMAAAGSTAGTPTKGGPAPQAGPAAGPAAPAGGSTPAPPASGSGGGSSLPGMPQLKPPDVSSLSLTPPKKLSGGDLGGFLAALLLYTLALNFITHGPEGVKGWFAAKLLNQPVELDGAVKPHKRSSSKGLTSTRPTKPVQI